jgi:hypothetical protein
MLVHKKTNNGKIILIAVLAAVIAPWLAVGGLKGFQKVYGLINGLPAWQQTATLVSLMSIIAIVAGYFLYIALRRLAIRKMHIDRDKPRQMGVRLFGGGFADVIDKINTDRELKYRAVGFAFVPRSIKGNSTLSICEEPFPCTGFPVREAVRTWSGAVAQRHAEEQKASSAYTKWAGEHREIVALLDIVGKGQGYTGLSCLHGWQWLSRPDVFRFLFIVFDPEEARTENNIDYNAPDNVMAEEEETCVS